jgi:hypothetical protein
MTSERQRAVVPVELDDSEVDIAREPSVEPYFFLAEVAPSLECREIQEPEVDGLLHLVNAIANQEDP